MTEIIQNLSAKMKRYDENAAEIKRNHQLRAFAMESKV
jgi:hypothetical protein